MDAAKHILSIILYRTRCRHFIRLIICRHCLWRYIIIIWYMRENGRWRVEYNNNVKRGDVKNDQIEIPAWCGAAGWRRRRSRGFGGGWRSGEVVLRDEDGEVNKTMMMTTTTAATSEAGRFSLRALLADEVSRGG